MGYPTKYPIKVLLRLNHELAGAIEAWRKKAKVNRSEAIRRLVAKAIDNHGR